jgi:hypothetical protein
MYRSPWGCRIYRFSDDEPIAALADGEGVPEGLEAVLDGIETFGSHLNELAPNAPFIHISDFSLYEHRLFLGGKLDRQADNPARIKALFVVNLYEKTAQAQIGYVENAFQMAKQCRTAEFQPWVLPPLFTDFNMLASNIDHLRKSLLTDHLQHMVGNITPSVTISMAIRF